LQASQEFKDANAKLHVITAESAGKNGGAEIKERLAARQTISTLDIISDPEHKLLLRGADGKVSGDYVILKQDTSAWKSLSKVPYKDYNMVQPGLTVIQKGGKIQQMWTWKTGALKGIYEKDTALKLEWSQVIPEYNGMLVGIRPQISDILPSIKENRDVALAFQDFGDESKVLHEAR